MPRLLHCFPAGVVPNWTQSDESDSLVCLYFDAIRNKVQESDQATINSGEKLAPLHQKGILTQAKQIFECHLIGDEPKRNSLVHGRCRFLVMPCYCGLNASHFVKVSFLPPGSERFQEGDLSHALTEIILPG